MKDLEKELGERIESDFTYHKPFDTVIEKYNMVRNTGKSLAKLINDQVPWGREKMLALTKLEEAVMWANAGIARNEKENDKV